MRNDGGASGDAAKNDKELAIYSTFFQSRVLALEYLLPSS